jgi:hypothetical protein
MASKTGLTQPAFNTPNWDVPLNSNFDILDNSLGGVTSLSSTNGIVTLTSTQYQKAILNIPSSVTLTGNLTYRIPSGVIGTWVVSNLSTQGAFSITIDSAGGGVTFSVPPLSASYIFCDGTNVYNAANPAYAIALSYISQQASASDYRGNTTASKFLNPNGVWSAMSEVTLTDASTISWDMSTGFDFTVTLGGNRIMGAPTNPKTGQKGRLIIAQDATGGRSISSWNGVYDFSAGVAPTLSTASSAINVLYYDVRNSSSILILAAGTFS